MKKFFIATIFAFFAVISAFPQNFVVVGSETKIYDQPSVKGYVTLNSENREVCILPGMSFKNRETKNGWTQIEYVPGITGFVMESSLTSTLEIPEPGSYHLANGAGEEYKIDSRGSHWSITGNGVSLNGELNGRVVVFKDKFGNPMYTLTRIGDTTYLYSYLPEVTHFL